MDKNTTKLIEELAKKLGTTTEYLWSILLRQAPIDATIQLVQTLIIIVLGFILWNIHKKFIKENEFGRNMYEEYEFSAPVLMIIAVAVYLIFAIILFCDIGNIINGYFNPEYWALNKILK